MQTEATGVADWVVAAQRGDRAALGELIEAHLTMLYNVAGRALNRHADVDDVVQETLLRVVENLSSLREPARFSGWILAILHRQIAERIRRRRTTTERVGSLDLVVDVADPGADFADATVLRLGLSDQRRQIVEAVRWLDPDERFLLSLWWLEVAGSITRADLATAVNATAGHAAVRLKRMRDQLELARCIVNALQARPLCPALGAVIGTWDGEPSTVWRKRLGRHLRDCPTCSTHQRRLVPPDRLLAGVAMLPVPPSIVAASPIPGLLADPVPGSLAAQLATTAGAKTAAASGTSWWAAPTLVKTVVAAVGAVAVTGGVVAALPGDAPDGVRAPSAAVTASAPARTTPAPATASPARPAPTTPTAVPARYGSVVDRVDAAPPKNRRPRPLPARPEGTLAVVASGDNDPRPNVTSLIRRGQWATYRGRGYLRVEFAVAFTQRTGTVTMPSWTGLKGKLFHVASGGGRRLDDQMPNAPAGSTGMGDPTHGYAVLPDGAQQMWAFEYYHLDGEVTLTSNERGADYNLYVTVVDRATIESDIRTAPNPNGKPVRYGLTRDDGTDACPVPQYAARANPQDTATVPQHSNLR